VNTQTHPQQTHCIDSPHSHESFTRNQGKDRQRRILVYRNCKDCCEFHPLARIRKHPPRDKAMPPQQTTITTPQAAPGNPRKRGANRHATPTTRTSSKKSFTDRDEQARIATAILARDHSRSFHN